MEGGRETHIHISCFVFLLYVAHLRQKKLLHIPKHRLIPSAMLCGLYVDPLGLHAILIIVSLADGRVAAFNIIVKLRS